MSQELTRLMIPAPVETRRSAGVTWYEARVDPDRRTENLEAFAAKDTKLAEAEIQLSSDRTIIIVIKDGDVELTIETQINRDNSGTLQIQCRVNGQHFEIAEQVDQIETRSQAELELSLTERETLRRWGQLAESCEALAQATRQSWGIVSCTLLGGGVGLSAALCLEGVVASCAAGLVGAATVYENCF